MKTKPRSNVVPVTLLTVMTLTLCGGCAPIDYGELEAFAIDMLRNAAAAMLL